ncbi:histidine ammonia-lyase [Vibrio zhanjiangensis]|uniref:Histidine ammonia-lyase n=1 Tax=Vibrio zhanjiangensis TaxID=1046128 RepID=A0ABQ6F2Y0_9VIBR|nr:aromatic amino acid ammonia-lyase [Vibrio zhanjiangensis]GLT19855.1 histidine ammonia-lyase [Vibrio zhanjiangensis]
MNNHKNQFGNSLILGQGNLTLQEVVQVAQGTRSVALSSDAKVRTKINQSFDIIQSAIDDGSLIYGVNSGFGGMADIRIDAENIEALQENLIHFTHAGTGKLLSKEDTRAAMLIRAHSHSYGSSGIRAEFIERLIDMLNLHATPHVYEYGSIGASGDLVPLSHVAGAMTGLSNAFTMDLNGQSVDAISGLAQLGLPRLKLKGKEGLAMINGTSFSSAIAVNNMHKIGKLIEHVLWFHGAVMQGMQANTEFLHPYVHQVKPHKGQLDVASRLRKIVDGSLLLRQSEYQSHELAQDRYSLRCACQYLAPIIEGFEHIEKQVVQEINSVTDNPIIDSVNNTIIHGGNFLAQHIGIGMDHVRQYIGLMAKHIDSQIALMVHPEFSNGLPKSLVGNTQKNINMGLKGLQICANSMMPRLTFLGNTYCDHYATHAEQFNQNINSFGSAMLARESIDIFQRYLAIASIFAVQAIDLRTYKMFGHYIGYETIAPATREFYSNVYQTLGKELDENKPLIYDDDQQSLTEYIEKLYAALSDRLSQI